MRYLNPFGRLSVCALLSRVYFGGVDTAVHQLDLAESNSECNFDVL